MKTVLLIGTFIASMALLTACAPSAPANYTMGAQRPPTGRTLSPANIQGSALMNSSRMIAPTRP